MTAVSACCLQSYNSCVISKQKKALRQLWYEWRASLSVLAMAILIPVCHLVADDAGAPTAECHAPTLIRLESAAQRLSHMGRPTTAGRTLGTGTGIGRRGGAGAGAMSMSLEGLHGMSKDSVVDSAAVTALKEAAAVNGLAPVVCPAALLAEVAGATLANVIYATVFGCMTQTVQKSATPQHLHQFLAIQHTGCI